MYGVIPFLKVSCKTMTGEASTGWPKTKFAYSNGFDSERMHFDSMLIKSKGGISLVIGTFVYL